MAPRISVELEPWVERIVDETVARFMAEHVNKCPNGGRITRLELSFSRAVGMAIGAGAVGGVAAQLVSLMLSATK